jgi:serine protease Do
VGLIVAGVWDSTPVTIASDLALDALREPAGAVAVPVSNGVEEPPPVVEPADTGSSIAVQQGSLPSLRGTAAAVRPAVVSVQVFSWRVVSSRGYRFSMPPDMIPEQFREMFPDPDEQDRQEGEKERVPSEGSGFIFSEDGYIITNNHVVAGATEVAVVLPDKRRFEAEIIGADEITDVAVIKIKAESLPTIPLGNSDTLEIGDWVLAVGNPLNFDFTVTAGIVSAKGRSLDLGLRDERGASIAIQDFIQTDAAINRGNSGGPLVDLNGNVVGINSAIASNTGLYTGYGFAIPINLARTVARDLIEFGRVKRSWLGILFREINANDARARSLPDNPPIGALVTDVTRGGSADDAGLETNDIILEIDGEPIESSGQLQTLVSTKKPGTTIEMLIYRGGTSRREGRKRTLTVTLQERPDDTSQPVRQQEDEKNDRLGLNVSELTRSASRELDYDGEGVLVEGIERYGPAYDAGLSGGFILIRVDGEEVTSVEHYNRILEELDPGGYVVITYLVPNAQGELQEISATVGVR